MKESLDFGGMSFDAFFRKATERGGVAQAPYPYQRRLAADGLPPVLEVPTGAGKTAIVMAWLYRLLVGPTAEVRNQTPRRLLYVLPMRTLIDQVGEVTRVNLANLGLSDEVRVHVLMGGDLDRSIQNEWRMTIDKPTIVIATADCAISRLLLRGYGAARGAYPLDFALLGNDTHIVLDEVQLIQQATATARQIAGFQAAYGTTGPTGLTCMSATVNLIPLDVVDNPRSPDDPVFGLSAEDEEALRPRLEASKTIAQLPAVTKAAELAPLILDRHKKDTVSLVVVNTVDTAKAVYKAVQRLKQPTLLLHSRFCGVDKKAHLDRMLTAIRAGEDFVVVATQVVEAGIDIDVPTLFTEAAPWPSLCQRAGRLNRKGELSTSDLYWFPPIDAKKQPYPIDDTARSVTELAAFEAETISARALLNRKVDTTAPELRILRRSDFLSLFDTAPDLTGNDLDISPYIRENDDLDIQVAWIDATRMSPDGQLDGAPPPDPLRCPVRPGELKAFLERRPTATGRGQVTAWHYQPAASRWARVWNIRDVRPNDLIVVDQESGGYDPLVGFEPSLTKPVAVDEQMQSTAPPDGEGVDSEAGSIDQVDWIPLHVHLADAEREATELADSVGIPDDLRRIVIAAATWHDIGKSFPDWQQALVSLHAANPPSGPGPWAKSPRVLVADRATGQPTLRVMKGGDPPTQRKSFRHELISVLMLREPVGSALLAEAGVSEADQPLVQYLIGAHHGVLRVHPRDPAIEGRGGRTLLGVDETDELPSVTIRNHHFGGGAADLGFFSAGRGSWSWQANRLLATIGPFTLAYLEAVVRIADWRASANPTTHQTEDGLDAS